MKVLVATVSSPFTRGGAEALLDHLVDAVADAGHEVDVVTAPFQHGPSDRVARSVDFWLDQDFDIVDGVEVDRLICLKFPTYLARHPRKTVWLMHQLRGYYELWNQTVLEHRCDRGGLELRARVHRLDRRALSSPTPFTLSKTVSARLRYFSGLPSKPLYHPPPRAGALKTGMSEGFLLVPGRLVWHKRVDLVLRALAEARPPTRVLVAGEGPERSRLEALASSLGIGRRVDFLGRVSDEDLMDLYARCLAVVYAPLDEDYGYVTLEAMLAAKPVLTCTDSGGTLEFVRDGETGLVVPPDPVLLGQAINQLAEQQDSAARLGERGLEHYRSLGLSWPKVVGQLLDVDGAEDGP
ncbi:MAG: glycosyltransferase family 4 protein [Acidobacteriota bacterium]